MFTLRTIVICLTIIFASSFFGSCVPPENCTDADLDTYYAIDAVNCPSGDDCNDSNADVYPGASELCFDGVDNQCPGETGYGQEDEGCGGPMVQIPVGVPSGCFDMGDAFAEGESDELPVHEVCISGFWMDVHEVTNAEYAECVDAGECTAPYSASSGTRETYYGNPAYDDFPVIHVDWDQADAYCTWVNKRLPTEAEWEYAARGDLDHMRYPWGDNIDCSNANWGRGYPPGNSCVNYGGLDNDTHPIGSYLPNGYGLYDMAGNVWEWVADWHDPFYYSVSPVWDPQGPATGSRGVLRGGSYLVRAYFNRVAHRFEYIPTNEGSSIGFRCAR